MTLTAAAKIELIETALADGKYRTLQKQLRELRDAQQIIIQHYLSDSHESLKAEAQRLIDELRMIAETQDAIETVKQKTDEVLAPSPTGTVANNSDFGIRINTETTDTNSLMNEDKNGKGVAFVATEIVEQKINEVLTSLPTGTIVDNSDFGVRINTGNADEKIWLAKKDENGAGVTFVKTECGQYYESYAGDALRLIVLLGMPVFIGREALKTLVAVRDVVRLQEAAQKLGLTLHLYDYINDPETPQDATTTESEILPKFFSLNWQTLDFDSYDKPYPDQREYKPYPNIDQLIKEVKMNGRCDLTALWHPSNHPTADLNELINGGYGLRVACDLGDGFQSPYLFHESQIHRILR